MAPLIGVIKLGMENWNGMLVGYFVRNFLPFSTVKRFIVLKESS